MAGGVHASAMLCFSCAGRAVRIREGVETDGYCCETCGAEQDIDWSEGAPGSPCWPPSAEELEQCRQWVAMQRGR